MISFPVPSTEPWGTFTHVFLVVTVLVMPLVAYRSHLRLQRGIAPPPRKRLLVRSLLLQWFLVTLAFRTAVAQGLDVLPPHAITVWDVVGAVVPTSVFVGLFFFALPHVEDERRERLRMIAPRDGTERVLFVLLSLSAGFGEEVVYRGVLWSLLASKVTALATLLLSPIGGLWLAAPLGVFGGGLVCAAVFGVGHMFQGPKSAIGAGILALVMHTIAWATGGLYGVIVFHALYDAAVGLGFGLLDPGDPPAG